MWLINSSIGRKVVMSVTGVVSIRNAYSQKGRDDNIC